MSILGNATGGFGFPKTFVLVDENGNEMTGVVVGEEQVFTATPADVRIGKRFASNEGVQEGENTITYRTEKGVSYILDGNMFSIYLPDFELYNYTQLHCMIAPYNDSLLNSVAVDKVVINDCMYATESTVKLADVIKNNIEKTIDLNIINDSGKTYVIHYFIYKQEEV